MDDDFLETLQQWLVAMSLATLRSVRHTATAVALWTVGALAREMEQTRADYDVAVQQRDAESRRDANRTRLVHTAQKMEALDAHRDALDAHVDELVSGVFVPRSRDYDAAVRLDCIAELGAWTKTYPSQFLQEFYFRHTGAALTDPDTGVRLAALRAAHAASAADAAASAPLLSAHKARIIEMARYDVDVNVRTAAFALLESAHGHGALDADDRSALAVHVYDAEPRIRVAAASFLAALLGDGSPTERVSRAASLLVEYDAAAGGARPTDEDEYVPLAAPQLGRIGAALEALWTASEAMRAWEPYVEVALSDALDASADAAALEMLAAAVRLTAARTDDADAEEPAIAACSAALVDALPRLLAKYSSDAARLADVLLLPAAMDLAVYADTQNLGALDSLWDTVCAHFMRHVAPAFLRNAAEALRCLAAAPGAPPAEAKLLALRETVLAALLDTMHQREIETTLFTEDDVHNLHASLARLCALLRAMDVSAVLDDDALWHSIVALARRGRLGYAPERRFVRLALHVLSLYVLWRAQALLAAPEDEALDALCARRADVFQLLHGYLEPGALQRSVRRSCARYGLTQALECTLVLYTLSFAAPHDSPLHTACPADVQQRCAVLLHSELEAARAAAAPAQPHVAKAARAARPLTPADLSVCALGATYVAAVRTGALDMPHAAAMLAYYAHLHTEFDALCHELITVLRDDALHAQRAWAVCETIVDALRGSFALLVRLGDDASEAHFVALARHLSNATMLRGPGFSVVAAVDAQAMVTLHVAGCQEVLRWLHDGTAHAPLFFRGLAQLLGTITPADAMQIHAALQQRLAAAHVDPAADRAWDAYAAYEKRLLGLAAKDADLVQEAAGTTAAP